ncbi:hypothetical protein BV25DRAFT_1870601 [Artomyces pyxidatus]|uniref:Uncharacterized protein n=1 Tax=Artomyces pyxidatus TaxID=48021 RepID=A0ACB8T1N9_9AGAM|nr:hypothetical protein BV25DRAFT_1870601 [Artomyces pyxidatus]
MSRHVQENKDESQVMGILRSWVNPKRQQEVTRELISDLNALSDEEAEEVLLELKMPKRFIRSNKSSNQLNMNVVLTTQDTDSTYTVEALLDSGCTGSCINRSFIARHKINTHRAPRPIAVYNADGTLNKGGSITEFVHMRMTIGEHVERIHFGISSSDMNGLRSITPTSTGKTVP